MESTVTDKKSKTRLHESLYFGAFFAQHGGPPLVGDPNTKSFFPDFPWAPFKYPNITRNVLVELANDIGLFHGVLEVDDGSVVIPTNAWQLKGATCEEAFKNNPQLNFQVIEGEVFMGSRGSFETMRHAT